LIKQKSFHDFNVDRLLLPARATLRFNVECAGKIAYLSTSRDAIWTYRVQVFCVEV